MRDTRSKEVYGRIGFAFFILVLLHQQIFTVTEVHFLLIFQFEKNKAEQIYLDPSALVVFMEKRFMAVNELVDRGFLSEDENEQLSNKINE